MERIKKWNDSTFHSSVKDDMLYESKKWQELTSSQQLSLTNHLKESEFTLDEYNAIKDMVKQLTAGDKEVDWIISVHIDYTGWIYDNEIKKKHYTGSFLLRIQLFYDTGTYNEEERRIYVGKMEDDWFNIWRSKYSHVLDFYRCDELDGVVECLQAIWQKDWNKQ